MKIIAALIVPVMTLGVGALTVSPAAAHTPDISADCNGVHVGATAYDADQQNRWSVTIGGATQSGTFGSSFDQTFPVPQNGATTTWSAFVEAEDGSFHGEQSGAVGPCGTPADDCADLPGDQPVGTPCLPPADVSRSVSKALEGCNVTFGGVSYGAGELTYDEQFTDTHVFNPVTNTWDLVTGTTPTPANLQFTPWSVQQQVQHECADKPAKPAPIRSSDSTTHVDCDDEVVVTTTVHTVTAFVYDAATNTWVPGQPKKHTTTSESPVKPGKCADDDTDVSPAGLNDGVSGEPAVQPAVQGVQVAAASEGQTPQVPTAVDAGLTDSAPAAAAAVPFGDSRVPALLLLLVGAALASMAGTRLRRN
jgi:hypothetical protein